jgi:hypothetical protein
MKKSVKQGKLSSRMQLCDGCVHYDARDLEIRRIQGDSCDVQTAKESIISLPKCGLKHAKPYRIRLNLRALLGTSSAGHN